MPIRGGSIRAVRDIVGPVFRAGPEEAAEAVAFGAGDDVDVEVRDALADGVVDGDEGALGAEGGGEDGGDAAGVGEERKEEVVGKVGQRFDVPARDDEDVPVEEGAGVEEGEGR